MFPNACSVIKKVCIGGVSKAELLERLSANGVSLNESGIVLFRDSRFTTSEFSSVLETVETSVADLGYPNGATMPQIYQRAAELGLSPPPLELGPHLRLQFQDQAEGFWGHPPSQHRAPSGSITVASLPLSENDEMPKGFYLRRIKDVLWLRGYCCDAEHIWSPEDRLVFYHPNESGGPSDSLG